MLFAVRKFTAPTGAASVPHREITQSFSHIYYNSYKSKTDNTDVPHLVAT